MWNGLPNRRQEAVAVACHNDCGADRLLLIRIGQTFVDQGRAMISPRQEMRFGFETMNCQFNMERSVLEFIWDKVQNPQISTTPHKSNQICEMFNLNLNWDISNLICEGGHLTLSCCSFTSPFAFYITHLLVQTFYVKHLLRNFKRKSDVFDGWVSCLKCLTKCHKMLM